MNDQFTEGRFTYVSKDTKREYHVYERDEFIGSLVRINPYGVNSTWNAIDPAGRIVARCHDRTGGAEFLARKTEV